MNYYGLLMLLKDTAEHLPNVNTTVLSDVYKLNMMPDAKYSVFAITPDSINEDYYNQVRRYTLNLYMIDRLGEDGKCEMIQSQCIEELSNIIKGVQDSSIVDVEQTVRYVPFTQQFSSECAGVYATVTFEVPLTECYEEID